MRRITIIMDVITHVRVLKGADGGAVLLRSGPGGDELRADGGGFVFAVAGAVLMVPF